MTDPVFASLKFKCTKGHIFEAMVLPGATKVVCPHNTMPKPGFSACAREAYVIEDKEII